MIHQLKVSDLMTTDLITLDKDENLDVAEDAMRTAKIHHLPVVEGGCVVGMVAQSDILRAQVSVLADLSVTQDRAIKQRIRAEDVMCRGLRTVGPDTPALEAAQILASHDYSCLPIVEDGKLVGIVTERDFLKLVIRALSDEVQPQLPSDVAPEVVAHA